MEKNHLKPEELKALADQKMPADRDALAARLGGKQPTIDIAGHTFFVDLHRNLLRPKDDFSTTGISFSDIDYCFNDLEGKYQFAYNPATHQSCDIDSTTLTEIPKDIILVEVPPQEELDPVGYARKHGWGLQEVLKEHPVRAHFQARIIPWNETPVPEIIKENLQKLSRDNKERRVPDQLKPKKKRGPKL